MSTAPLSNVTGLTNGFGVGDRPGFLARIEKWFRPAPRPGRVGTTAARDGDDARDASNAIPSHEAVATREAPDAEGPPAGDGGLTFQESHGALLRPRADRDAVVDGLRNGIGALGEVMSGIRDSLEKQASRQEELLRCLSQLPEALRQLPESARLQGEALKAVCEHVARQGEQQGQVADVLERISRAESEQGRVLDAMCRHESAVSESLGRVGEAMQAVGAGSEAGARVLEQVRDGIHSRDGELERAFKSHDARITTLLCVAVGTSLAALASVAVAGFLLWTRGGLR